MLRSFQYFVIFMKNVFFSKSPKSKVIIKHKKLYCHQQKPELLSQTWDSVPYQEERWHGRRTCFLNVSLASIVWKSPRGMFDNNMKSSSNFWYKFFFFFSLLQCLLKGISGIFFLCFILSIINFNLWIKLFNKLSSMNKKS